MMVGIVVDLMLTLHIVVSVNAVMIVVVMQQAKVSTWTNFSTKNQIIEMSRRTWLNQHNYFILEKVISKVTDLIKTSLNRM